MTGRSRGGRTRHNAAAGAAAAHRQAATGGLELEDIDYSTCAVSTRGLDPKSVWREPWLQDDTQNVWSWGRPGTARAGTVSVRLATGRGTRRGIAQVRYQRFTATVGARSPLARESTERPQACRHEGGPRQDQVLILE